MTATILCAVGSMEPWTAATAAETPIRMVFRYDDYSNESNPAIEERLLEIFASANGRHVFSVIPFRRGVLEPSKAALLHKYQRAGSLEIAMHGYHHVRGRWGEMCSLSS